MAHFWTYRVVGINSDTNVGPIAEAEIVALAKTGKLNRATAVWCATRTNSQWLRLDSVPGLLKIVEQFELQLQAQKDAQRAQKEAQAEEKRRQQQAAVEENTRLSDQFRARLTAITDCQDLTVAARIANEAQSLLTQGESIEYIAVQQKPININPDAIVITNRRVIVFRPKLLGQFSFDDYHWRDLSDAHLTQGIMASAVSLRHVSGRVVKLDWIPKEVAQKVYRIAQHREEEALEVRRQRDMEIRRSSAANITVGATPAPVQQSQTKGSPMDRLKSLKDMFDAQLITQSEFEKRKAEILAEL